MNVKQGVFDFIRTRLESWLTENASAPRDVIRAVLAEQAQNPAGAARDVGGFGGLGETG